jgi:hypothetical protein
MVRKAGRSCGHAISTSFRVTSRFEDPRSTRPDAEAAGTTTMSALQNADRRVDDYLDSLPVWQKELCAQVRRLIHEAEPEIEETIKRRDRPYFLLQGNVCALQATKDHVNIFIYDPVVTDPQKIINQGEGNKTARAIQIFEHETLNEAAFKRLISAVAANNRAGGWRRLSQP